MNRDTESIYLNPSEQNVLMNRDIESSYDKLSELNMLNEQRYGV